MSRHKKRRSVLQRVAPYAPTPGGTMYTLPPGAAQSIYGQTFYGGQAKNLPTQGDALFSPGVPLYPVKGINPGGLPIQWRFPPQYNTFPASDRSLGNPDIPSFEQLRSLARLFYGVGLCERTWLDMVPRMQLQVKLTKEATAGGAETKAYQDDIAYFQRFFEKPDGRNDAATWLRMALREQTQIDELYIYKNRKRNGDLLGLSLVAGDQMKPLLDEWGHTPEPPEFAYQQYPWGIPGYMYTVEQMIHYQESPAVDTPYGFSRVERIILIVNLALKKLRKDLAHYASGNIPYGIMEVPGDLNWTPDQIDAYEQMWNSLLAGNAAKQVQVKFTQPGMKYTKLDDFSPDTPFDEFLLNVSVAAYGLSMQDIAFTGDIHKSSGDSQQNMTYRRTIDPLARVYAALLTACMREDFEPSLHGDLLEVSFGGFDEEEDLQTTVAAYAQAAGAGLIGLTDAAKALNFPEPKDAPYIGRVMLTKDGPIFLDDIATPEARKAAADAKMAGYEMAANPPTAPEGEGNAAGNTPPTKVAPGGNGKQQPPGKASSSPASGSASGSDDGGKDSGDQTRAIASGMERAGAALSAATDDTVVWKRGTCTCDACQMNAGQVRSTGEVFPSGDMQPGGHEGCDCTLERVALDRHLPGKHDQSEHGVWAHHGGTKTKGHHTSAGERQEAHSKAVAGRLQQKSVYYDKLANKPVGKHWTAQEQALAGKIAEQLQAMAEKVGHGSATVEAIAQMAAQVAALTKQLAALSPASAKRAVVMQKFLASIDKSLTPKASHAHAAHTKKHHRTAGDDDGEEYELEDYLVDEDEDDASEELARADIKRWRGRALDDIKAGRGFRPFQSEHIPDVEHAAIEQGLTGATTADEVRAVFERARAGRSESATAIAALFEEIERRGAKALTK